MSKYLSNNWVTLNDMLRAMLMLCNTLSHSETAGVHLPPEFFYWKLNCKLSTGWLKGKAKFLHNGLEAQGVARPASS